MTYTVTAPDGKQRRFSDWANEIGYYYEPDDNFIVEQPGRYTVDLQVTYDGSTSAGQVTSSVSPGTRVRHGTRPFLSVRRLRLTASTHVDYPAMTS